MNRLVLIKQHDEKDCGAACLSMILNYYGKKLSLAVLREAIKVDQYGANIDGILKGAKKYGLSGCAFKGNANAVWKAIKTGEAVMPAIIRIINDFDYEHYVVVNGIKGNNLIVYDPDTEKSSNFKKENMKKGNFSIFFSMIFRQKTLVATIGILSIFITGISLSGTFLFQYLIDNVIGNISKEGIFEQSIKVLAVLILALIILYLFKFTVEILRGKLLNKMSKNLNLPLILGYYDHVTKLPMNFFDIRKTGEIISRFSDASKICEAVSGTVLTIMIDFILVVFCGVVLYKKSSILFLVAAAIFFIYLLISAFYIKPLTVLNKELMEQNAQFNSYLKETIDGMETVKSFQAEHTVNTKVHNLFINYINQNIKEALIQMVTAIGTLILLWGGVLEVVHGNMTAGSLLSFYSLMNYFLDPVQNIVGLQSSIQTAIVAADRLNDIMDLEKETGGTDTIDSINSISLKNVFFRYGNRNLILNNISLEINKGEHIAFVGESGCGKSTIIKLLMGFYYPESGFITLNGKNIQQYSIESLRTHIAYVPQSTFLFSDTIRNNLLFGIKDEKISTDAEITHILNICCCDFIKDLPLGIDSMLEENGANLSGGQRQRLAIARALLRKPELLILDEATSALDSITEQRIAETLTQYYSEMIVITVTHRLSTIKDNSRIVVLDHGVIMEEGSHNSLLELNDQYARLWDRQN